MCSPAHDSLRPCRRQLCPQTAMASSPSVSASTCQFWVWDTEDSLSSAPVTSAFTACTHATVPSRQYNDVGEQLGIGDMVSSMPSCQRKHRCPLSTYQAEVRRCKGHAKRGGGAGGVQAWNLAYSWKGSAGDGIMDPTLVAQETCRTLRGDHMCTSEQLNNAERNGTAKGWSHSARQRHCPVAGVPRNAVDGRGNVSLNIAGH
ncbi:hypothetical protein C8R45DRAFT_936630 [Mycena sanguinolenta]|nr:hypothetical protein C8R45DRAFT_936630 [Mycena sanguinolenta]